MIFTIYLHLIFSLFFLTTSLSSLAMWISTKPVELRLQLNELWLTISDVEPIRPDRFSLEGKIDSPRQKRGRLLIEIKRGVAREHLGNSRILSRSNTNNR